MMLPHAPIAAAPAPEPPRESFERFWRWMIEEEPSVLATLLPDDEWEPFAAYYRGQPSARQQRAVRRRIRGAWRGETGWAARWIARRRHTRAALEPVRVLDAGCGFGTHALLFASMGADVRGVDLRPDRLRLAERRADFYRRRTRRPLAVEFRRADLTRAWDDRFDMVWVHNALSHIEPLEGFLGAVREHLAPGGVLVIGDINGAHAEHRARLARLRTVVASEYVAPDGARHGYALERLLPPEALRALMTRHGMRVTDHELYWGGLGVLPAPLYDALLVPLQRRWRLGVGVARRQLLVATPV